TQPIPRVQAANGTGKPGKPSKPGKSVRPARRKGPTPEALAAEQDARLRRLASDVDTLAARLAPAALQRLAEQTASSAMTELRARAEDLKGQARARATAMRSQTRSTAQHLASRAGLAPDDASRPAPQDTGAGSQGPGLSAPARLSRMLDDARDGEPVALGAVTAAALGLVGLGAVALVKAITAGTASSETIS
ncbi:hypothetical protein, partial [Actinomyces slackii]